ncbi:hypothetical protein GX51_02255 [Blastomyces parvus]|uniref:Peptidase S8/S53 domain-containing protein n=1 Tax=Blastomyces parvus TaxID=2060905 RepID=A0A2B7XD94_9EURO|nr:hypothetical protein GX51_02255 [Blastomyces parvus]
MLLSLRNGMTITWIALFFTALLVRSEQCPDDMYWCQDRCGTDIDTCCQTPDGQYNLCGLNTICCGFGCCPTSAYTCNADFSCTGPNGEIIPPAPRNRTNQSTYQSASLPPAHLSELNTKLITTASNKQPTGLPRSQPQNSIRTLTNPSVSSSGTYASQPTIPPPGQPGIFTETGREQPTVPPVAGTEKPQKMSTWQPGASTMKQHTDKYTGHPIVQPTGQTTPTTDQPTEKPAEQSTTDSTSLYASQPTAKLPEKPTRTTEVGTSFPGPHGPVIIVDTRTATLPVVTSLTTFIILDHTFTLTPSPEPNTKQAIQTWVIIGTSTATLPLISATTTLTTLGLTFTLEPPSLTKTDLPPSGTTFIAGTNSTQSLTSPPVTGGMTLTTEHQTITPRPNTSLTNTVSNPQLPITTASQPSDAGDDRQLPTYHEWPSDAVIVPVEREVEQPEPSDGDDGDGGGVVIPCKLWFFSICIRFGGINIRGWKLNLPSGIYPPGPPPPPNIKLPPGINFQGELPPWPKFTVGAEGIPTFPKQPEPTKCETRTASLCSTTTSYVVSTIKGALQTVSSHALPPECHEVRGCVVSDSNKETTQIKTDDCVISTVTDAVVTCSGTGTRACSTETKVPKTGCSISPTTETLSCAPAHTGKDRRQVDDNSCTPTHVYYVWPRDGRNADETAVIYTELKNLLQDETRIRISDTRSMGINFWRVPLAPGQVQHVKAIPNVVAVYRDDIVGTADMLTQANLQKNTNLQFQTDYMDEEISTWFNTPRRQVVFLSTKNLAKSQDLYLFDRSAGEDIPVYILDTGARIDHPEFTQGDNIARKVEFIYADEDHDHAVNPSPRDDSALPRNGICTPTKFCKPHGTSMLSIIAGAKLGVAKKVKPYLVRTPRRDPRGSSPTGEGIVLGLSKISDRYSDNSGKTRAILSMSLYYNEAGFLRTTTFEDRVPNDFMVWKKRTYELLTDLIRKGIFVVCGAGNSGADFIDGWPALFGANPAHVKPEVRNGWLYIPELLVVGGVSPHTGKRAERARVDVAKRLPHVYAPSEDVVAAEGDKRGWPQNVYFKESEGTSIATAYAAGMAAYFLKLHEVGRLKRENFFREPDMSPIGLKKYIINTGVARAFDPVVGPVVAIYNGAEWSTGGFCPYDPNRIVRRQADDKLTDQCMAAATSTGDPTIHRSKAATATATDDVSQTTSGTVTTPSITTNLTASPKPTEIGCTPETSDQCVLALKCGFPRRTGCRDGKCVCILPPPPPPNPPQSTNKEPTTLVTTTTKVPPAATEKPKVPLKVSQRQCHDSNAYKGTGDITGKRVEQQAASICGESREIRPGESITDRKLGGIHLGAVPYFMSIHWKKDCEMGIDIVNPAEPLPGTKCVDLLYENWEQCRNNAGRGGFIDVGCLRYEFIPRFPKR